MHGMIWIVLLAFPFGISLALGLWCGLQLGARLFGPWCSITVLRRSDEP